MNILQKIKAFEFDTNRNAIFGIKSGIVWGFNKENNSCYPLLYISKPKNLKQEDFELLLDKIKITIEK